jgi:hypothetical protein
LDGGGTRVPFFLVFLGFFPSVIPIFAAPASVPTAAVACCTSVPLMTAAAAAFTFPLASVVAVLSVIPALKVLTDHSN